MSRYAARIGSALVLIAAFALCALPARADQQLTLRLNGKAVVLGHVRWQYGARAIAADDAGLAALLNAVGATLTWQPGERYILFTTGEPVVISFAVGDTRYDVGPVRQHASFAPFILGGHAYVPLDNLLHALDFAIRPAGSQLILQPQLASLDVQPAGNGLKLIAHAGIPLDGRITARSGNRVIVTFDGVATTLQGSQVAAQPPVQRIDFHTIGTVTHPQTQVTIVLTDPAAHVATGTDDQRDFTIAFNGAAASSTASAPQTIEAPEPSSAPGSAAPEPAPVQTVAPVQVTAVQTQPQNGSMILRIAVNGNTTYDWHRLRPPDNRFWLDVHNARLAIPPENQPGSDPVTSVRVHQEDPTTVRVALSLADFDTIDVTPNATGVTITVNAMVADDTVPHGGSGTIGTAAVADNAPGYWKFSPRPDQTPYVAPNPRLIVIDPGHGGSDSGAYRGDVVEKVITLDISKRLRDILVSRGWQVIMTRDTDRDVYKPDDSAAAELQARDDIANRNGARLLVSIHVNSFVNAGPHGATVYYYKPTDLALAQALDHRIGSELSLKNDGIVKDKLYVVHHADMPAALVETAFVSNPDDRALLADPQWRQEMAQAIADGIEDYAGAPPAASTASGQ